MLASRIGCGLENKAFGWKHSTHRLITEKVVNRCNLFMRPAEEFNYEILKYSCVHPDSSRKNITRFVHGHFADIDKPSYDPPDALELTGIYSRKAGEAHRMGLYQKRDDYLGYALHFLQDMLNPVHVVFIPAEKDHPERVLHKDFEALAAALQDNVVARTNLTFTKEGEQFFEETLPNAMRTAKNQLLELKKSGSDHREIAREAIRNTYLTTNAYIEAFIGHFSSHNEFKQNPLAVLDN